MSLTASFQEKLQATQTKLFFSKNDPLDPRLGEIFKPASAQQMMELKKSFLLVGYKDDRGIKNNGGREGAHQAPDGIRNFFYRLTANSCEKNIFFDLGNWETEFLPDLIATQDGIKKEIQKWHQKQNFIISLGGGHDFGYPDTYGFISSYIKHDPKLKPLILNFDAHLDVRTDSAGINSGTSFYKILKEFHNQIDFYEIGIQSHCNSSYHAHFVENHHGKIITVDDIKKHSLNFYLSEIFKKHSSQALFVSLDIDVLHSSEAPGCSQSWPMGLGFQELMSGFDILTQFKKWQHLGIYEVSPALDVNANTQRAAALFMNKFFHYFKEYHYESC